MSWAITGTGMVTSVGSDVARSFASFVMGRSGNAPLRGFDGRLFRTERAYEIADRHRGRDRVGRATAWLLAAVEEALRGAELPADGKRIAVLIGTGLRELRSVELWWTGGDRFRLDRLHFAGAVERGTGARTAGTLPRPITLCNACSASLFALGLGSDLLALGEADAVVVGGVDALTESMYGLLDRVSFSPPDAVRPFDRQRSGVLLGEGAAAVVLEPATAAHTRGATVLATLRGVGLNCDAYHPTAPDPAGMAAAMRNAHRRAGVDPGEIDLLVVHGTGTVLNDNAEAHAIGEVFGSAGPDAFVTALKSMTGHTSGASGLVGLVTAVECLARGIVPPTPGLREPEPVAETFRFVTDVAKSAALQMAQVNAFGFGGVNAVAVVEAA